MKIAFCTTCKGRVQHIEKTLPKNLADNSDYSDCIFVILDYGSPDHLLDYLRTDRADDMNSGRLIVYSHKADSFCMAHAKNMAHRLGMLHGADVLVNLDADNFTGKGFATYIANSLDSSNFLWSRMVKDGAGRLPKGISGRIAVTRKAFLLSGGYDERFNTWAPDDKDFDTRLRRLGYVPKEIDNRYLQAILHNDKMRFKDYPCAKTDMTEDQFHSDIYESDNTIVNYGRIGCGVVYRRYTDVPVCYTDPVTLQPVPTRIFGIGMHKTATTSLDAALKILGFDSAHWKNAHWAKAIWQQMQAEGKSLTLEQHYALCDLPIPILFRELDEAYPGSKFILTVREEENWLRSVRNHWDFTKNPWRVAWNTDPFSHKIHNAIYGRRDFDEATFRARYRKHNADVLAHFAKRPQDLLILDMERPRWGGLCKFLDVPVPDVEYPKLFTTTTQDQIYEGQGI